MFNRQPFNRGKFNASTTQNLGANGIALMLMQAIPTPASKIISAIGLSNLIMKSNSDGTITKYNQGATDLILSGKANSTKRFIAVSEISNLSMTTLADQTLSGESVINLEGIILKPNDELIINTCDMTITINGQNAMQYFSNDSEFFKLLSGLNTLEYSDSNVSRKISLDVIWKDRWL